MCEHGGGFTPLCEASSINVSVDGVHACEVFKKCILIYTQHKASLYSHCQTIVDNTLYTISFNHHFEGDVYGGTSL